MHVTFGSITLLCHVQQQGHNLKFASEENCHFVFAKIKSKLACDFRFTESTSSDPLVDVSSGVTDAAAVLSKKSHRQRHDTGQVLCAQHRTDWRCLSSTSPGDPFLGMSGLPTKPQSDDTAKGKQLLNQVNFLHTSLQQNVASRTPNLSGPN